MPELLCKVGNARMGPSDLREQNRCRCGLKKILKVSFQFGTCWQGYGTCYILGIVNGSEKLLRL